MARNNEQSSIDFMEPGREESNAKVFIVSCHDVEVIHMCMTKLAEDYDSIKIVK